eukprot:scaffold5.g927.t1
MEALCRMENLLIGASVPASVLEGLVVRIFTRGGTYFLRRVSRTFIGRGGRGFDTPIAALQEFDTWMARHSCWLDMRAAAAACWGMEVATQRWAGYTQELGDAQAPQEHVSQMLSELVDETNIRRHEMMLEPELPLPAGPALPLPPVPLRPGPLAAAGGGGGDTGQPPWQQAEGAEAAPDAAAAWEAPKDPRVAARAAAASAAAAAAAELPAWHQAYESLDTFQQEQQVQQLVGQQDLEQRQQEQWALLQAEPQDAAGAAGEPALDGPAWAPPNQQEEQAQAQAQAALMMPQQPVVEAMTDSEAEELQIDAAASWGSALAGTTAPAPAAVAGVPGGPPASPASAAAGFGREESGEEVQSRGQAQGSRELESASEDQRREQVDEYDELHQLLGAAGRGGAQARSMAAAEERGQPRGAWQAAPAPATGAAPPAAGGASESVANADEQEMDLFQSMGEALKSGGVAGGAGAGAAEAAGWQEALELPQELPGLPQQPAAQRGHQQEGERVEVREDERAPVASNVAGAAECAAGTPGPEPKKQQQAKGFSGGARGSGGARSSRGAKKIKPNAKIVVNLLSRTVAAAQQAAGEGPATAAAPGAAASKADVPARAAGTPAAGGAATEVSPLPAQALGGGSQPGSCFEPPLSPPWASDPARAAARNAAAPLLPPTAAEAAHAAAALAVQQQATSHFGFGEQTYLGSYGDSASDMQGYGGYCWDPLQTGWQAWMPADAASWWQAQQLVPASLDSLPSLPPGWQAEAEAVQAATATELERAAAEAAAVPASPAAPPALPKPAPVVVHVPLATAGPEPAQPAPGGTSQQSAAQPASAAAPVVAEVAAALVDAVAAAQGDTAVPPAAQEPPAVLHGADLSTLAHLDVPYHPLLPCCASPSTHPALETIEPVAALAALGVPAAAVLAAGGCPACTAGVLPAQPALQVPSGGAAAGPDQHREQHREKEKSKGKEEGSPSAGRPRSRGRSRTRRAVPSSMHRSRSLSRGVGSQRATQPASRRRYSSSRSRSPGGACGASRSTSPRAREGGRAGGRGRSRSRSRSPVGRGSGTGRKGRRPPSRSHSPSATPRSAAQSTPPKRTSGRSGRSSGHAASQVLSPQVARKRSRSPSPRAAARSPKVPQHVRRQIGSLPGRHWDPVWLAERECVKELLLAGGPVGTRELERRVWLPRGAAKLLGGEELHAMEFASARPHLFRLVDGGRSICLAPGAPAVLRLKEQVLTSLKPALVPAPKRQFQICWGQVADTYSRAVRIKLPSLQEMLDPPEGLPAQMAREISSLGGLQDWLERCMGHEVTMVRNSPDAMPAVELRPFWPPSQSNDLCFPITCRFFRRARARRPLLGCWVVVGAHAGRRVG